MKLFLIICMFLCACLLNAELEFQQKSLNLIVHHNIQTVDFDFKFKNVGKVPISITNIQTSCDCTTSIDSQRVIKPGEGGLIKGNVHLDLFEDFKYVMLTVKTDTITQNSVILSINLERTKILEIKPRLLFWKLNSPSIDKSFTIKISKNSSYKLKEILLTSNNFEIKKLSEDNYSIKPKSTKTRENGVMKIILEDEGQSQYTYIAYLVVK